MSAVTSPATASPGGLPRRAATNSSIAGNGSDDEFGEVDPNDTAQILEERLQAWKHACGYLENYVEATEKMQKAHAKEYEKVLKTIANPLREGHHFDPTNNGINGFFDNMRSNTQGVSNLHAETAKSLDGQVMPILKRLHQEIKSKNKELTKGANQGSKAVAKARAHSQKHIEQLGAQSAQFDTSGGKIENAGNDPYVLHRAIKHRLYKQVIEENSNRNDLIAVQESFSQFESHVVQTFQQAVSLFIQIIGGQAERQRALYTDMGGKLQNIPLDYEWMNFLHRYGNVMIDPSTPPRKPEEMAFTNEDHKSAKPLISGTLERKSRMALAGYKTAFYAVTPAKYLHQYEDQNNYGKNEPSPDLSLYLPDCSIGAVKDNKFNIKGKDVGKGKVGNALQTSHELQFKAHSPSDAQEWWRIIAQCAGQGALTNETPTSPSSATTSPIATTSAPQSAITSPVEKKETAAATAPQVAVPTGAPASATAAETPTSAGAVPPKA